MKKNILFILSFVVSVFIVFQSCKDKNVDSKTASISLLDCGAATFSATATNGSSFTGTASVPYTGGNGATYNAGSAISSTGVTGLTATLNAGTLASGSGSASFTITGTPQSAGTAVFAISVGGKSCSLNLTVNEASATVTGLTCTAAPTSAVAGTEFSGSINVAYTGGNGGTYEESTASSTGITGLTAKLAAGTLQNGDGSFIYEVTGKAESVGKANFELSFGGQTCSVSFDVVSDTTTGTTNVQNIVGLSNAFLATLSTSQKSSVIVDLNLTNAKKWSNLPCGLSCRQGLLFSSLSATQLEAAKKIIKAASGTSTTNGYSEFLGINTADAYLGTLGGGDYSSGNYIIAFLGTPSTSTKWMLQFGGHHYAQNIIIDKGAIVSTTPSHQGVEPTTFSFEGTDYAPMSDEKEAMADMLASFTAAELATAKSSSTFTDATMVPGSTTNTFPTTKLGIKVSALSTAAQAKVMAAMMPWINDLDDATAAEFTKIYKSELADTYVMFASNLAGTPSFPNTFFTAHTDYVRIDGPSVWIEFVCQNGVVVKDKIHYHSVYRDHKRDYFEL